MPLFVRGRADSETWPEGSATARDSFEAAAAALHADEGSQPQEAERHSRSADCGNRLSALQLGPSLAFCAL